MSLLDPDSLAQTAENINHAVYTDAVIDRVQAKAANEFMKSCYRQDIPKKILQASKPNPAWASIPKSFNLTESDRQRKPRTFTGESVANASLRMVHSREAARAQLQLASITGESKVEAEELCATVRQTAERLSGPSLY